MSRVLAVLLIATGLALLAWQGLRPMAERQQTAATQEELLSDVPTQPAPAGRAGSAPRRSDSGSAPAGPQRSVPVARSVPVGEALAVMRIPRFGEDWEWAAVEGTELEQIDLGPGHYPRTPLPGAVGNVSFAGHRAGHGDPFIDFDKLEPGDDVVFEQGEVRWTYEIDAEPAVIPVTASWVLAPFGRRTDRDLTLTTCWPRYGSSKRMYVRGHLDEVSTRGAEGPWRTVWTIERDTAATAPIVTDPRSTTR